MNESSCINTIKPTYRANMIWSSIFLKYKHYALTRAQDQIHDPGAERQWRHPQCHLSHTTVDFNILYTNCTIIKKGISAVFYQDWIASKTKTTVCFSTLLVFLLCSTNATLLAPVCDRVVSQQPFEGLVSMERKERTGKKGTGKD